jgi:hypothetical protein
MSKVLIISEDKYKLLNSNSASCAFHHGFCPGVEI